MSEVVRRLTAHMSEADRLRMFVEFDWESQSEPLTRTSDATHPLDCVVALMEEVDNHKNEWGDRAGSDRWLAPRLHYALRLSRAEAADPDLWAWFSIRFLDYVEWRWSGKNGTADNRFRGPIHKQAFSRLWWGAELFRNGPDYRPVEKAFAFQDLPNSYLHRPFVRCRSLALGLVGLISVDDDSTSSRPKSADDINDLARVINLATSGAPPETETDYQQDDFAGYQVWLTEGPPVPATWEPLPHGPHCNDTSEASLIGGNIIAERAWSYAHATAERAGTRSSERRRKPIQTGRLTPPT